MRLETWYVVTDGNDNYIRYIEEASEFTIADIFDNGLGTKDREYAYERIPNLSALLENGEISCGNITLPLRVKEVQIIEENYDIDDVMTEIMDFHKNNFIDKCLANEDYDALNKLDIQINR